MNPAEFGNLTARHNFVEIAEACGRETDGVIMDRSSQTVELRMKSNPNFSVRYRSKGHRLQTRVAHQQISTSKFRISKR